MIPHNLARAFIQRRNLGFPRLRYHCQYGIRVDAVVIQQVWTVTGHQDLRGFRSAHQCLAKRGAGCRMQGGFRFLDADQGRRIIHIALQQRRQDTQCAQGAIGHVLCEETPGMLGACHVLAKLQRFHRPNGFALHSMHHRCYRMQIFLYQSHLGRCYLLQMSDHASDVLSGRPQQSAILWLLQFAHQFWVEVIEAHRRQRIEHRAKSRQA
ncbi:Uncharacterised protein [Bordetella pertussis]|nr:Uncharacterised protein [Bordetella pertussis]